MSLVSSTSISSIDDDRAASATTAMSLSNPGSDSGTINANTTSSSSTLYVPIVSPPTPAPSPRPSLSALVDQYNATREIGHISRMEFASLSSLGINVRKQYLAAIVKDCTPSELLFISSTISPLLKRDFLSDLPPELGLHILHYIDDPKSLARASRVSRSWNRMVKDDSMWKRMCELCDYEEVEIDSEESRWGSIPIKSPYLPKPIPFSYKKYFESCYKTETNWRQDGRRLREHRPPSASPEQGVATSIAMDSDWIVVGLANCRIHVFSTRTGVLSRTLTGHNAGVWSVNLVSAGGKRIEPPKSPLMKKKASNLTRNDDDDMNSAFVNMELGNMDAKKLDESLVPDILRAALGSDKSRAFDKDASAEYKPKPSDVCGASEGWGNENALVVSGSCDKSLRVWDVMSGYCIYVLQGHTSTIRCARVLHNRPIAVTGSRDTTLRVWDVQRGCALRVLEGHEESVRTLDVCGSKVVSGSYDCTCRLWDVDTGECLRVFRGHFHQIYSVAYDGVHVVSGGLDTTIRVWDPETGENIALLQGHTALVCQLQLVGDMLASGGSDGRVITFSLTTNQAIRRIVAHDSSVTALQIDPRFLVTGGCDGRVKLFETLTGTFVRDLTTPAEAVWKVMHKNDVCVILCKKSGKTFMEIWSYRPVDE